MLRPASRTRCVGVAAGYAGARAMSSVGYREAHLRESSPWRTSSDRDVDVGFGGGRGRLRDESVIEVE